MPESAPHAPHGEASVLRFLRSLENALSARVAASGVPAAVARLRTALERAGRPQPCEASRLPVCDHLAHALGTARTVSEPMRDLADSFAALDPSLHWARRPVGGPLASENWPDGHANSVVIGPGGLERREELLIGASLMAPHVRYPDHSHMPEEVYIVLSPGRFKHGATTWTQPGIGGTFHNVPNVTHAMASDDAPFLAIWTLWNA